MRSPRAALGSDESVNTDALFWIAVAAFLAACLAAIAARSLHGFSRSELEEICRTRQAPELFADILRRHERVALGVEMVVAVLVTAAISAGALWAWQSSMPADASPWLGLAIVVLVLGSMSVATIVWIPWSIARIAAARFLYRSWPLWNVLGRLALPLVWSARIIDALLHRLAGRTPPHADEESIEEEIRTIVSEGHREGLLEEEAREMIEGVIELGDAVVSHIMTPRTEINMIPLNTPWDEAVESIVDSGHTRVPVFDKTRDDIVGMLYSKDLLPELAKGADEPHRPLSELLRKPLFVPETKPVDDLLQLFQKSRTHIAVVLDEYGGVSGLVTIEDVLEEIVGEIDDEYDQKSEAQLHKIDDDTCEALGRAHVDQINALMGFELPENEDFDTIGGFVFAEFGRVPTAGESITWQDAVRVTVLEASRRRVNRVRLERVRKESLEMA
ncbi:MAG: hemolysin family protein [Planctomycetes bacterium]|nr:hemolysin family protein [Planctomycetota bacterium]